MRRGSKRRRSFDKRASPLGSTPRPASGRGPALTPHCWFLPKQENSEVAARLSKLGSMQEPGTPCPCSIAPSQKQPRSRRRRWCRRCCCRQNQPPHRARDTRAEVKASLGPRAAAAPPIRHLRNWSPRRPPWRRGRPGRRPALPWLRESSMCLPAARSAAACKRTTLSLPLTQQPPAPTGGLLL